MPYALLSAVRSRIRLGAAAPFNIRDIDHTLLLARGQLIRDEAQLDALFSRGAVVDAAEVRNPRAEVDKARADRLPALWSRSVDRVGGILRTPESPEFAHALDEAAEPVLALVQRDPDLAIFQVIRQADEGKSSYGVSHSVHAAIACYLVAQRLGWGQDDVERVFKAALTMNVSMIELQGRLATQLTPPTAAQRKQIHEHPHRSAEMLEASGVTDADWLNAVRQHHEVPGGHGYPSGAQDVSEMASLLRRVDVYTAKLSPRNTRQALAANQAGRDLFLQDSQHPMSAAIIKEFGIYPPGCPVQLQSGEVGIVVKRGPTANTPLVAALSNGDGDALREPVLRRTEEPSQAVVAVVPETALRVRVSPEKLLALAGREPSGA
ncbi:MAG TPA: HD domain-containing phosphohydrolase [Rhizobacter sp.]|nr:HD domain-containing phosphohydrolase [Rhizobacter sp.]